VRPTGPGHLAQIARFLSTRFSSHRTGSGKLEIQSLQKFLLVRSALFLLGAAIPSPTLAQAQPQAAAVFHFSKEVHWGGAVLPPGDYVITSLDVKNTGAVLTFATPNSQPQSPNSGAQGLAPQEVVSGDSPSANGGFFTIHNPRNQTVPYPEVQAIYLSACKVVEQEFSRVNPIRPRLTLLLGAGKDRVYYPEREIQLTKWDKLQFAQGVVLLAVADMVPKEEQVSLTKLAVFVADSTVDVRELKGNRTLAHAGPRN
jgi:hypothetical protein